MKNNNKNLMLCSFFTSLIICGAYMKIPLPFIPVTLQTAFVTLSGLILGAKQAAVSALAYLLLGLIGFPVFTSGGGLSYIFNPTFGYIIGFIFGAAITGFISHRSASSHYKNNLLSGLAGLAVIYACGIIYYCLINTLYLNAELSLRHIFTYCFLLTAPTDIILTAVISYIALRISSAVKISN